MVASSKSIVYKIHGAHESRAKTKQTKNTTEKPSFYLNWVVREISLKDPGEWCLVSRHGASSQQSWVKCNVKAMFRVLFLSVKQDDWHSKFLKWLQVSKERKAAVVGLTTNCCALYHAALLPMSTHTHVHRGCNPNLPITTIMATTNWPGDGRGTWRQSN